MDNTKKSVPSPAATEPTTANGLIFVYIQAHFKNREAFYGEDVVHEGFMRKDCLKLFIAADFTDGFDYRALSYFSATDKQTIDILHVDHVVMDKMNVKVDQFVGRNVKRYLKLHNLRDKQRSILRTAVDQMHGIDRNYYSPGVLEINRNTGGPMALDLTNSDKESLCYILHKAVFIGNMKFDPRSIKKLRDLKDLPVNSYDFIVEKPEYIAVAFKE